MTVLERHLTSVESLLAPQVTGAVAAVRGLSVLVNDLRVRVGTMVRLEQQGTPALRAGRNGSRLGERCGLRGEVVGFDGPRCIVMLFDAAEGIAPGTPVVAEPWGQCVPVGRSLLGRVIDSLGNPIDDKPAPLDVAMRPIAPEPIGALQRSRICEPLVTGVRAIDGMLTVGKGQRVGIFSGAGVGKSTLLASIARNTSADVNVIALVGERGREVREFIERTLSPESLARSVIVVATSDETPVRRVRAASVAAAVAEFFRDEGADVLLLMDSITRFAQAQRQIGLTVGEQAATKGYTPSVFAMLPMLLERAGAVEGAGSITGLYAVLVEGDDINEPVSDTARGVLDGHIVLSRTLAARAHFPAIDVRDSVSRLAEEVSDEAQREARRMMMRLIANYGDAEDLINIGAYARGSNPDIDIAIDMKPIIDQFLQQQPHDAAPYPETCKAMLDIAAQAARSRMQHANAPKASRPGAKSTHQRVNEGQS